MSTYNPKAEGRSASRKSKNTSTCNICQAVYAPAQEYEYLFHAPQMALESAFMSMCHFCFRCRQPSCPNCWDYVHGVCGRCTLEANLPFRSPVGPLRGVFFSPTRQILPKHKRASQTRLICIRPGRFQNATATDSAKISSVKATAIQNIPHPAPSAATTQNSSQQMKLAETKQGAKTIQTQSLSPSIPHTATKQRATPPTTVNIDEMDTQPGPRTSIDIDEMDTQPGPRKRTTSNAMKTQPGRHNSLIRRVERFITFLLFILLLFIILLIALAEASQNANGIILRLAHIDIRAETAYILQLIRHFFS